MMNQDQVVYTSTSGATTRPNMDQYNLAVEKYGQDFVDQFFSKFGQRVGSGINDGLVNFAKDANIPLNDRTSDYLIQAMLNERSDQKAFEREVFSSKNQYQWLVQDLQKAGLNPFLALSGLNAAQASSTSSGVSGGSIVSRRNNESTNQANIVKTLIAALGSIIGIALFKKA